MYKIIGADGKEYGPVSAEQLRQWVGEGRASARTQVSSTESPAWQPLGQLPEFVDLFRVPTVQGIPPQVAPPLPPAATSSSSTARAEALATSIAAYDYQITTRDWISRGWKLVMSDFWLLVGVSFVAGIIAGSGVIGLIIGGPMLGGLYGFYLKKIRGQTATFGDAFNGFSVAFVPLMLTQIVSGLLGTLGLLLCLVPGIYLIVSWTFALPLVFDKKLEFWDAMELSRKIVGKHWWPMFGFMIVCGLVAFAGLLACIVGVFVTSAVVQAAHMYAYEDIIGNRSA